MIFNRKEWRARRAAAGKKGSPSKTAAERSAQADKDMLSAEDRASMFIDWCALSGFGLQGWPSGAYEQLVAHIKAGAA